MTRLLAATLALLLLAGALLPAALADHTYSHRYVVVGRIVDAEGAPIVGAGVSGGGNLRAEGECGERPEAKTDAWPAQDQAITDARGEFRLCFHVHEMALDPKAEITLTAATAEDGVVATARAPLDPRTRVTFAGLVAEGAYGGDAGAIADSYLVAGRLWAPWARDQVLDNVKVHGLALADRPVRAVVVDLEGREHEAVTTTNGYGDFAVRVPLDAEPERIRVHAGDDIVRERAADPLLRFTAFEIETPPVAEVVLVSAEDNGTFSWRIPRGEVDNPPIIVLPNATVTVFAVNTGAAPHRFEAEGGPTGETVEGRGNYTTYRVTAPEGGSFAYFCAIHPEMRGEFVVDPDAYVAPLHEDEPAAPTPPPAQTPDATATPAATTPTPTPTGTSPTPGAGVATVLAALLLAVASARRGRGG